jgi:hypothetical protein
VLLCTSDCSRSSVGGDSLILKNCNSSHQFVIVVRAGGQSTDEGRVTCGSGQHGASKVLDVTINDVVTACA